MTPAQRKAALAAIWETMIERTERLHDTAVLGQSQANHRTAVRLASTAEEIAALARAAMSLSKVRRKAN